ncbi:MAG: gamma-glutamylcyclotransferase family protein [Phycisphaerae bacterium]|jgi:gamma-glutamylcyclotransferase (GGCT)/AIG2-like uncharacterized protein YtfP
MASDKGNLFVYGSLRDRNVFKSVSGYGFTLKLSRVGARMLYAELALLNGYRKVSPDNVYYYAVRDDAFRIDGYVIYDVPAQALDEIDRYEGKRYKRQIVTVDTANGPVKAHAYLVSRESMRKYFGDRFHVNLIHELWLRKRIDKFLKKQTRPGERSLDAELERQADRELLATTERDLLITHYHSDAVSDYFLEHELKRPRPSIKYLLEDELAVPFVQNYLDMVIRQVMLNQLEEKIYSRHRFDIDHIRSGQRYYNHSISLLIAMQMMNANNHAVNLILKQCREKMPYKEHDLIDYVKYAVRAARSLLDERVVHWHLSRIVTNFHPGIVPLGAEIELSDLGFAAVEPQRSIYKRTDPVYDGFRYFNDFKLDVLTWKTGGYIDDHSGAATSTSDGRMGFLELAPGRLNTEGEISRPATADPWVLNRLITAIVTFYNIRPHSLHLSFQLMRRQIGNQQPLPLEFAKCLLAMSGDLKKDESGKLQISRMQHDEITSRSRGEELVFARTGRRTWYLGEDELGGKTPRQATSHVQQYKFIRLQKDTNYEPLILCLKGLGLAYNPGDYLTAEQLQNSPQLRNDYETLKQWSNEPGEIDAKDIDEFIRTIRDGLMIEKHGKPAHELHYINWAMSAAEMQLRNFNLAVRKNNSK